MKVRSMRPVWRLAIAAVAMGAGAIVAGCGRGGAPANVPMQKVGVWQVGVMNQPDPAHVGDNTLIVVARDSSGKPMHGSVDVIVGA